MPSIYAPRVLMHCSFCEPVTRQTHLRYPCRYVPLGPLAPAVALVSDKRAGCTEVGGVCGCGRYMALSSELMPWNWKKNTKKVELEPIEADTDRGPCLHDIDFELAQGQLCAIVGKVSWSRGSARFI